MDWILAQTVEQSPLGASVSEKSFTDLDYADDVAEMLETLVAGLLVLQEDAAPIGLQNSDKLDKNENSAFMSGNHVRPNRQVLMAAENVDLVNNFVYRGLLISHDG